MRAFDTRVLLRLGLGGLGALSLAACATAPGKGAAQSEVPAGRRAPASELPASDAGTDADADAGLATSCERRLERFASGVREPHREAFSEEPCTSPCRRLLRLTYIWTVDGDYPIDLSRAQARARELGLELVEWVPQVDRKMKYVLACSEE